MNAEEAIASHAAFIGEIGETIYIRRFTGVAPSRTSHDTATTARVMGYRPNQLVGPIVQGDRRVIALVDTLSSVLPLTTNDFCVVRGKQLAIKAVDDSTRRIGGTLIALEIQVGG